MKLIFYFSLIILGFMRVSRANEVETDILPLENPIKHEPISNNEPSTTLQDNINISQNASGKMQIIEKGFLEIAIEAIEEKTDYQRSTIILIGAAVAAVTIVVAVIIVLMNTNRKNHHKSQLTRAKSELIFIEKVFNAESSWELSAQAAEDTNGLVREKI